VGIQCTSMKFSCRSMQKKSFFFGVGGFKFFKDNSYVLTFHERKILDSARFQVKTLAI
jgi:hypothetical protein